MEDDADRWEDKVDYMVAGGKYMVYVVWWFRYMSVRWFTDQ